MAALFKEKVMLRLYIVRHGETLFNVQHKIQGWCDSPLTEEGILQAKAVGIGLKDTEFAAAYSSTSERAFDTAALITAGRDLAILPSKHWKEFHFGTCEGEPEQLIMDMAAEAPEKILDSFAACGGDTTAGLYARLQKGLSEIRGRFEDGNILVVSHGGAIMTLAVSLDPALARELFEDPEQKGIRNCSVTTVVYDNGWKLERANDVSYRDAGLKLLGAREGSA